MRTHPFDSAMLYVEVGDSTIGYFSLGSQESWDNVSSSIFFR